MRDGGQAPWEFYDLDKDIGESDNLAARQPEVVRRLAFAWERWDSAMIKPLWGSGPR